MDILHKKQDEYFTMNQAEKAYKGELRMYEIKWYRDKMELY